MSVNRRVTDRGAMYDVRLRTVDDVAREWLANNPAKRPGTLARDDGIIRLHLDPVLGPRPLGTITPGDVQTLVNRWSKRQKPRTVRRQFGVVRAVFRFAVERDYIGRSPCRGIKLLEGLTFHDLRRANATALVLDGVDLKTAQTRLGHSDPRLTLAV